TFGPEIAYPVGLSPIDVVLTDVNRDRKLDIALINYQSVTIGVLLGKGNGTFQSQAEFPIGGNGPGALAAGDLNNDRYPDLALISGNKHDLRVFLNDAVWTAPIPPISPSGDIHPAQPETPPVFQSRANVRPTTSDAETQARPHKGEVSFVSLHQTPVSDVMDDLDEVLLLKL